LLQPNRVGGLLCNKQVRISRRLGREADPKRQGGWAFQYKQCLLSRPRDTAVVVYGDGSHRRAPEAMNTMPAIARRREWIRGHAEPRWRLGRIPIVNNLEYIQQYSLLRSWRAARSADRGLTARCVSMLGPARRRRATAARCSRRECLFAPEQLAEDVVWPLGDDYIYGKWSERVRSMRSRSTTSDPAIAQAVAWWSRSRTRTAAGRGCHQLSS